MLHASTTEAARLKQENQALRQEKGKQVSKLGNQMQDKDKENSELQERMETLRRDKDENISNLQKMMQMMKVDTAKQVSDLHGELQTLRSTQAKHEKAKRQALIDSLQLIKTSKQKEINVIEDDLSGKDPAMVACLVDVYKREVANIERFLDRLCGTTLTMREAARLWNNEEQNEM